jgi:hypothetical protein
MARLVEAFEIDRRMPRDRHGRRIKSSWPTTPIYTFVDMVGWDTGEASERVLRSWEKTPASPQEVTRMEQAFEWLMHLSTKEARELEIWAKCTAFGLSLSAAMKHRGLSRTTFYRKRDQMAGHLADRLNRQGVAVR